MSIDKKRKLMLFPRIGKFIIILVAIAFIIAGIRGYQLYQYIFRENVNTDYVLYVHPEATFGQITDSLKINDVIISLKALEWVSKKKEFSQSVKTGRYLL
jgi:UPF0755 protein